MIDTIKLIMPLDHRLRRADVDFLLFRETNGGVIQGIYNPTAAMKNTGRYLPRLTYTERPRFDGESYELAIELSLPKLVFGENFSELTDADYSIVEKKLKDALRFMGVGWYFNSQIDKLIVGKIDFAKNVVFDDFTSVASVIRNLATADISRVYDAQNTDFRNGGYVWHIHTNSLDIAVYDKIADLKQSRKSEKRSMEKYNSMQLNLLDGLEMNKRLSVLRFEVRLNGKTRIREILKVNGFFGNDLTFKQMFSSKISQKILLGQWNKIFCEIPKIPLDSDSPDKIFAEILKDPKITPQKAFAKLGCQWLATVNDGRFVRNLVDDRFSSETWSRISRSLRDPPGKTQLKTLLKIENEIREMRPTNFREIESQF